MVNRPIQKLDCERSLFLVAAGWASVTAGQTQSPALRPEFEVMSVKPAPLPVNGVSSRESADNGLLTYTNFTLRRLISNAYGVTEGQIDGPAWISDNLYHIHARLPAGVSRSDVPAMLQTMLAERFKLIVERMKKRMPVYALVIAKGGHKMKPVVNDDSGYGGGIRRIDGRGITMATLAKLLSSRVIDSPVVDSTGLAGNSRSVLSGRRNPMIPRYTRGAGATRVEIGPATMLTEVITVTPPNEIQRRISSPWPANKISNDNPTVS